MKKNFAVIFYFYFTHLVLGQVKIFEPNVISDNQAFGLTISPDGNELFYIKSFGGRDTLRIYQSLKVNGKWQQPKIASFADASLKQIDPAFSPDGNALLLNALVSNDNSFDVYITHKSARGWSVPERLSEAINTSASDFYATMSKKKNIYFTRRNKSNDIYVSYFKDNIYQKAILLDSTINTDGNESNPYISPNEDFIIFFADYKNGYGESDLYISFKKKNKWSYPLNLGNEINTAIGEFCPSIDYKNNLFLFSRTEVVAGKRTENIYTYSLEQLNIGKLKKLAVWRK